MARTYRQRTWLRFLPVAILLLAISTTRAEGVLIGLWAIVVGGMDYALTSVIASPEAVALQAPRGLTAVRAEDFFSFRYRQLHLEQGGRSVRCHIACLEIRDNQFKRVHISRYSFALFSTNRALLADVEAFARTARAEDSDDLAKFLGSHRDAS